MTLAKAILLSTYNLEFKKLVINFPYAEELDKSCNSQNEMEIVLQNTINDGNLIEYTLTTLEKETEDLQEAIRKLKDELNKVYDNFYGKKPDEDFLESVNRREQELDTRLLDLNIKVETVGLSTSPSLSRMTSGCKRQFELVRGLKKCIEKRLNSRV